MMVSSNFVAQLAVLKTPLLQIQNSSIMNRKDIMWIALEAKQNSLPIQRNMSLQCKMTSIQKKFLTAVKQKVAVHQVLEMQKIRKSGNLRKKIGILLPIIDLQHS